MFRLFRLPWLRRSSPLWDEVDYWALDLETTGLDAAKDRILSVGMVPVRQGIILWGERFYSLVRPNSFAGLTKEVMAVHHILPTEIHAAPGLDEVLPEVERRLEEGVLLVHHAPVDVGFLKHAWRRRGRRCPCPQVVDTLALLHRLAHRLHQLEPYGKPLPRSLSESRAFLGLPPYDYHHALTDALATAELFLMLRARLGLERLRRLT
jgi:DNA polymerase-3 subunit epsilon